MARYDKYGPVSGGFRAPLAANFGYTAGKPDYVHADLGVVKVVSLNASGQVVVGGAAALAVVGVMILTEPKPAGAIVDVMTSGEIVEFTLASGAAAAAGTVYYGVVADGTYSSAAPAAGTNVARIGWTVEATRLVVRLGVIQG